MLVAATPFLSIVTPVSYYSFFSSCTVKSFMSMFDISFSRMLSFLLAFLLAIKFDFIRWIVL